MSPKNALETIIRFFTDSQEQKREQRDLTDAVRWQQERAEDRANKAKEFSYVMDRILGDHCRAAGVSPDKVTPMNVEQAADRRGEGLRGEDDLREPTPEGFQRRCESG